MSARIELMSARAIAGLIHAGRLNAAGTYQFLEEAGYEEKLELVQDILEDMETIEIHYKTLNGEGA